MDKQLHIVTFDVPWPANYGGAIDVFFKLRALHKAGVKITLHCFEYGNRKRAEELNAYCEQVFYYKRTTGVQGVSILRPYIVNSRKNTLLLKNLLADNSPILFEGLHTCYYLNHPNLKDRKKFVRAHNIEHDYYIGLAASETKWWKRMYYKFEAKLLKQYEVILNEADSLLAISESDTTYFSKISETKFLPAFHGNDMVYSLLGEGDYCFYHGNLSVSENEQAVISLIENVFDHLSCKTIIAGANPSDKIKEAIEAYELIELVPNPSDEQMLQLKREAHIHVLYSAQDTGTKLKLIDSLSQGRFVVANDNILIDDFFKSATKRANEWSEYIEIINDTFLDIFTIEDKQKREVVLQQVFSNKKNVEKLWEVIFTK